MDLMKLTAVQLSAKMKAGEIRVTDAVSAALAAIKERDKEVNAFITVDEEGAMKRAGEVQRLIDAGELSGPLAGVPIAVQIERKAATIRVDGLISMPAADAINVTAIMCIAVVPFIFTVIPVGRTKLLISSVQPSSSTQVLVFSGKVAADEFVAAANNPTLNVFFMKGIGFIRVVSMIPIG